jgi:GT2 family glycosyltransferase
LSAAVAVGHTSTRCELTGGNDAMKRSRGTAAISIVVPARNASRTIDTCLDSIEMHVPADLREIIVTDNGSTDDTPDLVRRHAAVLELVPSGFVSHARNVGARRARHPIIAFVDSDCVVSIGWYDAIVAALGDERVGVTGSRHVLPDQLTWCERVWRNAHVPPEEREQEDVPYIPAGNLIMPRALFLEVGGFDATLETGEDPDLCARVAARGYRVLQDRRIRCVHLGEPKTLAQIFRRERWHGRGLRLRYGDGRLAPVAISTAAFALSLLAAVVGLAAASATGATAPAALIAAPAIVPAAYTLRSARRLRTPVEIAQLLLIYGAYFLGRSMALPTVVSRAVRRSRGWRERCSTHPAV